MDDDDDYDPYQHREVDHPTNNLETFIHILKASLGTGVLSMPFATKQAGIWNGLAGIIFAGLLCTYCLNLLIKSQYVLCKKTRVPLLSYPDALKEALLIGPKGLKWFAPHAKCVVNFFLVVYQLGVCCVYVIFVAKNIKSAFEFYVDIKLIVEVYIAVIFVPFLLISYINTLKLLVPFSLISNVLSVISFGIILYYLFPDLPNINERRAFGNIRDYPIFFGTTVYSLNAVGVVVAIESHMKTPQSFTGVCGVWSISMIMVTSFFLVLGVFGYWKYGEECKESVTLNLPKEVGGQLVIFCYAIAIYLSYTLQLFVPLIIIGDNFIYIRHKNSKYLKVWKFFTRFFMVLLTFICAACIPYLVLCISLIGALGISTLGIGFPALMDICIRWPDKLGKFKFILIKDVIIIIIAILCLVFGTYSPLVNIVKDITSSKRLEA